MHLYMHPWSGNARRARITARLCALPVQEHLVDLSTGAQHDPAYLGLNPNGMVPTLVDGDVHLWESSAIAIYLAGKAGRTDLWPSEPAAQANVARWLFWQHNHWSPAVAGLTWQRLVRPMRGLEPEPQAVEDCLQRWARFSPVREADLEHHPFVCGDTLTLADVSLSVGLTFAEAVALPLAERPAIAAWRQRLEALPAWVETRPALPG